VVYRVIVVVKVIVVVRVIVVCFSLQEFQGEKGGWEGGQGVRRGRGVGEGVTCTARGICYTCATVDVRRDMHYLPFGNKLIRPCTSERKREGGGGFECVRWR